jgi:TP901 family phage tail tape measure protein
MADKRVSIVFDASMNIAQVKSAVGEIQRAFSNVTMPQNIANSFTKTMDNLTREIANFEQQAAKGLESASNFKNLSKSGEKILSLYNSLQVSVRQLGSLSDKELSKLFPPSVAKNIETAHKALDTYNAAVSQTAKEIDAQTKAIDKQKAAIDSLNNKMAAAQGKNTVTPADYKQMEKDLGAAKTELEGYQAQLVQTQQKAEALAASLKAPAKSSKYRALTQEIADLEQKVGDAQQKFDDMQQTFNNTTTFNRQAAEVQKLQQSLTDAQNELSNMTATLNKLQSAGDTKALQNLYTALSQIQGLDITQFPNTIDGMRQAIASLDANALTQLKQGFEQLNGAVEQGAPAMDEFAGKNREAGAAMEDFNRQSREVDGLKHRIQYFFGLTNSINLFRNAIRSAMNTVKELDKAMTETAVVTDFSVGDMWDKLPQYTDTANALGTTTLGAYQTMTLFYQQGLKTNEVFEIGTETMKMARIAGMDYTEATNMMTAALRGFNMELNKTSAQRVNDVYSKLAAITASDTQEISTAMTKTASIANNANMEFETTAAFLSQIIETTRESAETAGTAMKTVIARFQELKKDPAEIGLVDGEEVDANKIETALKTIGVALRDTTGQFRDLDDVFLEVASKWNSLDTNTQRYIATMAAGSRQQSRFIAMMSDYERTLELVDAAHNSAGASEKQFQKTTESLESKLNKLANAWDAFTMGLANSAVIKAAVDGLTGLINGVNTLTDGVGKVIGLIPGVSNEVSTATSGVAKFALAMAGLKAGSAIFDAFFVNLAATKAPIKALTKTTLDGLKTMRDGVIAFGTSVKSMFNKKFWIGEGGGLKIDPAIKTQYDALQVSIEHVSNAEARKAAVEQAGTATAQAKYQAEQSLLRAEASRASALQALGLTNESYNAIMAAGLTQDELAIVMSDSVAAAQLRQRITTEGLTAEQIKEAAATALNTNVEKMGILTRLKYIAMLLFGTQQARADAAAKLGMAAATAGATGAQTGLNAAMLACPLGWIIAGIVALTAAVYLLWKAYEAGTPEKQLENAQKAADAAADSVDGARKSVDELKTSLDELVDSYSNLDNLTKGTDAWRESVMSTNSQVLDLIKNYKELAPFVTNKNGVLTIDVKSPEVQGIIQKKENDLILGESMKAMADITVRQAEQRLDYSHLNNQARVNEKVYYYNNNGYEGTQERITKEEYDSYIAQERGAEVSVGVSSNRQLTEALAEAIASGKIFNDDTDGSYQDEILSWLTSQDLNGMASEDITAMSVALADNVDNLRAFGESLIASNASIETYRSALINNAKDYSNLDEHFQGDLVNQLDDSVFTGKLDEKINDETATITEGEDKNGNLSREDLQEYADLSQGKYEVSSNGKKIVDAESGEDVDITNAQIKQQLAAARATESLSNDMMNIADVFKNISNTAGADKAEDLAALMSSNGENISKQMLKSYAEAFANPAEIDWDSFAKDYNFDSMEQMAEAFGMSVEDMTNLIGNNFSNATNALNKQRTQIVGAVKKANKSTGKSYETIINELQGLEDKFDAVGADFNGIFDNVSANLARSGSEEISNAGIKEFWKMANDDSNSVAMIQSLDSFVSSIDWSNPIEAVYSLNQELANGTGLSQQFAAKMLVAGKNAYSAGKQMQYMLKSEAFEDVQEDINEIIAANGKLAASDVYDLASSYKTLDKFMANTGVTANGVAKALTAISKGKINMNQLTNAVLAALSSFDSLDGVVAKVLKTLEDFDPGADENDIAEFIKDAYETINENLEKGAVGNNQNFSYFDLLFGPQWRQKTDEDGNIIDLAGDELVEKMTYMNEKLRQNSEDMRQSWADLAAGKDIYGEAAGDLGGLSIVDTGQKIELTGFEGMTTQDILEKLQNAYHVSETYAEMMLGDFKNYSADLAKELKENDYAAAVQEMYDSARLVFQASANGTNFKGFVAKRIIDESEIKAVADTIGVSYDQLKADLEAKGALISNFYDEEGFLRKTSEIVAEAKRVLVSATADESALWYSDFLKKVDTENKINILDYDQMQRVMNNLNIPQEKFTEVATAFVQDIRRNLGEDQTVYLDYQLSDGSVTSLEITPDIDVETAIRNAETELQNSELAQAVADAFAGMEVTLGLDEGSVQQVVTTITDEVTGEEYTIQVTTDDANMNTVRQTIKDTVEKMTPMPKLSIETKTQMIKDAINNLNLTKEVKLTYTVTNPGVLNPSSATVPGHATGIKDSPKTHLALVAEDGPELIRTKRGAYVAEKPQMARIEKGDTVYTADQTKEILNRGPEDMFPQFATGYNAQWKYDQNGGGDGTANNNITVNGDLNVNTDGTEVADEPDLWKNPYDWLYNLTEKINENLRVRNNLEKKFQILQKRGQTNFKIASDYYDKQFELMSETYDLQKEMMNKRLGEMQRFLNENAEMAKYGTFNFDKMRIKIDWDLINSLDQTENTEEGQKIEDYISRLEDIQDAIEDAEGAMLDAQLEYEELRAQLHEDYITLEDRVIAALEQIDRNEVEALNQVYDAITDADKDLLEAMREQINEYRTARSNAESEEDIAKKERRLAYMRQDTSGSNQVDILKLEDEIEKARQQYQDQLVDQALTNLQTQQDYAAEQRDKQIALMESQIDWSVKNGVYAQQAAAVLQELQNSPDGLVTTDSKLYQILYEGEQWKSKSPTAIADMLAELQRLAEAVVEISKISSIENGGSGVYNPDIDYMAEMMKAYAAAGGQMTGKIIELNALRNQKIRDNPDLAAKYPELTDSQIEQELRTWWNNGGKNTQPATGITSNPYVSNTPQNLPTTATTTTNKPTTTTQTPQTTPTNQNAGNFSVGSYVRVAKGAVFASNGLPIIESVRSNGVVDGKPGAFKILKDAGNGNYYIGRAWTNTGVTGLMNKKYLTAYAHGGLADFTGPAWLDGTPSKPEAVLNAQDTRNFFELRDILRETLDGAASINKGGDTYQFDIDVNDPHVESDYDVDAMVARVERDIYDKSIYRNVNAVSRLK